MTRDDDSKLADYAIWAIPAVLLLVAILVFGNLFITKDHSNDSFRIHGSTPFCSYISERTTISKIWVETYQYSRSFNYATETASTGELTEGQWAILSVGDPVVIETTICIDLIGNQFTEHRLKVDE